MPIALVTLLYSTLSLIGLQQANPPNADEIMQRVRQAMNFSIEKIPEAGLILEGKSTFKDTTAKIRMHFNRQGHFLSELGTTLEGYDGKDVWSKVSSGESNLLELSKRRESLFKGALYSGFWVDKSSGMTYTLAKDLPLPDEYLLQFSHEPSQFVGTISIDKKSLLPRKCKYFSVKGEYVIITWKGTLSYEGVIWRQNIEIAEDNWRFTYQWESVTAATKTSDNPFRPQISPPTNMMFDAAKAALLEVKKANSGDLLVRPLVNGKDVGWFLLSSAYPGNVLHARTARKLDLETYGEGQAPVVGVSLSRLKTISLGRMTIQDPLVLNMELPADLEVESGVPIAGIIGQETFRCCVFELDYVTSQVAIYDPKTYEQERGKKNWQKLYIIKGFGVEAEFEGHKGIFLVGVARGNTVAIPSTVAKKLNLLEGRELKDSLIWGYRGKEAVKRGKLKNFEVGGHRHEDVEVFFATSETGALSNPDVIGMIGGELLKPFQLVFDYQNRRIAFLKRDAK